MKVCVIGLGYIGFPTACLVARAGHQVIGVDTNPQVVAELARGGLHIVNENGLEELAIDVLRSGRLTVQSVPEPADVFVVAVPTPCRGPEAETKAGPEGSKAQSGFHADLTYVESAVRAIAAYLRPGNLMVLESTVPPHTVSGLVQQVLGNAGVVVDEILLAHAPERVLPGNILHELVHNDRIVGGLTPRATQVARDFYGTFVQGDILLTDVTTAELVKLMENTFRDVNIALANEMARVCEVLGVDVWEAITLANRHPRVRYLKPGPGVGGHCIAVDPYFVIETAPELTPLIQTARSVNRLMPHHVLKRFHELTRERNARRVAILGAAYKADVGDDRESPALVVSDLLERAGFQTAIHDPHVRRYRVPVERVLDGADAIILLTDHKEYRQLDPGLAASLVNQPILLDTRGYLDAAAWRAAGFTVARLGGDIPSEVSGDA